MKFTYDTGITYMSNLQAAWYANDMIDIQEAYSMMENFKGARATFVQVLPLFFILDYAAKKYILMTDGIKNIAGYHPKEFLEGGTDKLIEVFHKDDFRVFNNKLFARNAEFLTTQPATERNNYVFSYNFRFRNSGGHMAQVLQRCSYITSPETGLPLYSLGVIVDINEIKTDATIVHTIEQTAEGHNRQIVERNFYYPNEEDSILSPREKDVLLYMAEGWSSKQIAFKLKISENTIDNHRQNMLRKTNTKNVAELIAFSIRSHII